ncbi:hypothetical protein AK830_g9415 [Neonectria ditissima]|uniref:Uncharacterized protein n=1 Tax=Neonectria ditissima TaxID=78410 RepID=A0A0P7B938_9HYPO|nr:hypothetical protein AK830_g9415 [Neonectria ditissima]
MFSWPWTAKQEIYEDQVAQQPHQRSMEQILQVPRNAIRKATCPDLDRAALDQTIFISFSSNITVRSLDTVEWTAHLNVNAMDLTCLMKEGFHWTEANVKELEGYFTVGRDSLSITAQDNGWNHSRTYFLTDLATVPQWTATLEVFAREIQVLSEFRIRHLSIYIIRQVLAKDSKGQWVYFFDAFEPGVNFNAIYDDTPLEGWWPSWSKNG